MSISNVKIVTDSTQCIPADLIKELEISVVPVGLVLNNKVYRDNVDITCQSFFEMFRDLDWKTTTTAASPGDFISVFNDLGRVTDNVLCILVSKVMTATQESAYLARKIVRTENNNKANIEIIDSRSSAGALGFIVLEAARAARAGKSLEEVKQVVRDISSRVIYLSSIDTLKYLVRTGRAFRGAGVGDMMNIKPIIGFIDDSGYIEVLARVRGKENAIPKLVDLVKEYADIRKPLHVMFHYSNCKADAEKLKDLVTSKYRCSEVYLTEYSPVMVSTTGPMSGLSFYS
jgi:DegV family protein with EDD domain